MSSSLEDLFIKRSHGAANIRGILYQIRYCVLRAFELYDTNAVHASLRLEGVEDLDLRGVYIDDVYVQIKNFSHNFSWTDLKEPFQRFAEVFQRDSKCKFLLVCGGPISKGIKRLSQRESLTGKDRKRLNQNIANLVTGLGISRVVSDALLNNLEIIWKPELEIQNELRKLVTEQFQLGSEAVEVHINHLVTKFLEWAGDRREVRREDIEAVRAEVGEALAKERVFKAYGSGLVTRVTWEPDSCEADFFEGKQTRAGHIVLGLDVERPQWLQEIQTKFGISPICIILSSSGQGKSTLLYRFAREQKTLKNTFVLNSAQKGEHVQQVLSYLRFWRSFKTPSLLLIDNAGWRTPLWPQVAQGCAEMGIDVLVSTRQEDWFLFRQASLTGYEIVEPSLNLDEAKRLFRVFKSRDKVHASVTSAEWAYEKVGRPHLLIEYVYLLTHGQMLEDRLNDQVRQLAENREDATRIQILRCTSMAHALGTQLITRKLLTLIHSSEDAQLVLQSLDGEYIRFDGETITGLHWVRSDHLVRILHHKYPPAHETAVYIMNAVPPDRLSTFIANAFHHPAIDRASLLARIIEKTESVTLSTLLTILDGIFEAGEREFFGRNSAIIQKEYQRLGTAGIPFLDIYLGPSGDSELRNRVICGIEEVNPNLKGLRVLEENCQEVDRGKDWCKAFLTETLPKFGADFFLKDLKGIGQMLEWCAFCGVNFPGWDEMKDKVITNKSVFDLEMSHFSDFALGLYRYDKQVYHRWLDENRYDIFGFLRLHTDSIVIDLVDGTISVQFFVESDKEPNEQAVDRLRTIRHVIPFCNRYKARGIWTMPYGLLPPVDDTLKDIEVTNLPVNPDMSRNKVFSEMFERNYLPDGFFEFQAGWHGLRSNAMLFAEWISAHIADRLQGTHADKKTHQKGMDILESLETSMKFAPLPPFQTPPNLNKSIRESTLAWISFFGNFRQYVMEYSSDVKNRRLGELVIMNLKEAMKALKNMQKVFEELFQIVLDHFDARQFNAKETLLLSKLDFLLDAWILDPPDHTIHDPVDYARLRREAKQKVALASLEKAFAPLREVGFTVTLPRAIHQEYPLKHVPIAIEVENPARPESSLILAASCLVDQSELGDFFYILPLYNGSLFLKGAYRIAAGDIGRIAGGDLNRWDFLTLLDLPEELQQLLPEFPRVELPQLKILGNINVLLGQLPSLIKNRERISSLRTSENRFDKQQHARLERKLHEFLDQLKLLAAETEKLIAAKSPDIDANPYFRTCVDFLKIVRELKNTDKSDLLELVDGDRILKDLFTAVWD